MRSALLIAGALCAALAAPRAGANPLLYELGRSESRVYSAPFKIRPGGTAAGYGLAERLDRLGYRRVQSKPESAGEYFFGFDIFWIHRRSHRSAGRDHDARLFGLRLDGRGGRILEAVDAARAPIDWDDAWIEPEVLAESLDGGRARRVRLSLEKLPEHAWRAVLAAEDARFFDHLGVDGRSVARALLANVRAGEVTQGGSTITQQLIKNRDLTPKRTLPRKASEAMRSLALEAAYDKEQILEAYLDQVYLGHQQGLAVHGFGTAAEVY
ncbi:MAG: biosynthetic peptidoglycan transglycosylase, partial [Acidobacteriota bacterium]